MDRKPVCLNQPTRGEGQKGFHPGPGYYWNILPISHDILALERLKYIAGTADLPGIPCAAGLFHPVCPGYFLTFREDYNFFNLTLGSLSLSLALVLIQHFSDHLGHF
jgi:hypothetical protein